MGRVVKEDKRVDGDLYTAAGEALAEASFRSGDFGAAEGLYEQAAAEAGDRRGEARAIGGLGMTHHYRNIAVLLDGGTVPGDAVDAEEELMRRSLELWQGTDDAAGTGAALFGVGLVMQVLRRDWDAAMTYFWPAFGLAEAVADAGDLYGSSEIHRHIGFYYSSRTSGRARRYGALTARWNYASNSATRGGFQADLLPWARRSWRRATRSGPSSCSPAR
jgi:hypothetical protein